MTADPLHAALAAALSAHIDHGSDYVYCDHAKDATAILATPAGQTIARAVATGLAVERLPDDEDVSFGPYTDEQGQRMVRVFVGFDEDGGGGTMGTGPTLAAAIAAALEGGRG
jgi:hypothetical protein